MKLKVAIIGSGNIGTDLLLKCLRINYMDVVAFVGRREDSPGIILAKENNINTSIDGINYFIKNKNICDVVFECTSADDAIKHNLVFKEQGIKVIDLTPAKLGDLCVPEINSELILTNDNVNMITCGGQASLPILDIISKYTTNIEYIEVVSQIASDSAGMATRINIDNYINTTSDAITKFTGCANNKVILNLNPAIPQVDMQTTIFIQSKNIDASKIDIEIKNRVNDLKKYIPLYEIVIPPMINDNGIFVIGVRVRGLGDYLPEYAGNLDIINCAAIKITEGLIND